jgi:hypothetical protein
MRGEKNVGIKLDKGLDQGWRNFSLPATTLGITSEVTDMTYCNLSPFLHGGLVCIVLSSGLCVVFLTATASRHVFRKMAAHLFRTPYGLLCDTVSVSEFMTSVVR